MRFLIGILVLFSMLLAGCGGSTGPATVRISGIVLWLATGGGPSPVPSVQAGSASVNAAADGTFELTVPKGTAFVLVTHTPTGGSPITFRFDFAPVTADTDIGDLTIGPSKISVTGFVKSTVDDSPISGATVNLAGKTATTAADGRYTLTEVAYDASSPSAFLSLLGIAGKTAFFARQFSPDAGPSGGVATVSDIQLQPDDGGTPIDPPFVIFGTVGPSGVASGSTVDLVQGSTVIRRFAVGADRKYGFWVPTGTYIIRAYKTSAGLTASDITVTLTAPTQTARRDVTLN